MTTGATARASTASWPTGFIGATSTKSKCGRPGTGRSSVRKSGTRCTSTSRTPTSAVWFPLLSKGCGADFICTPGADPQSRRLRIAVVLHQADRNVWRAARTRWAIFRLQHFWGPLANIKVDRLDRRFGRDRRRRSSGPISSTSTCRISITPRQKIGPRQPAGASRPRRNWTKCWPAARRTSRRLTATAEPLWLVASEYTIVPVDHVVYPNRVLREAGPAGGASAERRRASGLRRQPGLGHGRSSVVARLCRRRRSGRHGPRRRLVSPPRGNRRSAGRRTSGPNTISITHGPAKSCWCQRPTVGRPITIGWTMRRRRALPARSTSIASRATTRWKCTSIRPRAAFRSMPRWCKGSHGAPALDERSAGMILSSRARRAGRPGNGRHRRVRPGAAAVRHLSGQGSIGPCPGPTVVVA